MSGRPRLPISTFGSITTVKLGPKRFRATTVFRDWDGQSRQVGATRESRNAAQAALSRPNSPRECASVASGSP